MADSNEILIQVDVDTAKMQQELSEAIKSVAELKKVQKALKEEIEAGNDVNGEYAAQLADCSKELEKAQREVKNHTAMLQLNGTQAIKTTDSLDSQRQTLNALQKAYGQLSGEARIAADAEGGLRDQIKALSESVIQQEKNIGDARRNVGFYAESLKGLGGAADAAKGMLEGMSGGSNVASKAVDNLGKISKAFATGNPLMLILAIIIPLLMKLAEKLKESQKATQGFANMATSFNGVLKKLQPILDMVIGKIVDGLLVAIDWVMDKLKGLFSFIDRIGAKFGKDWGLATAFTEGAAASKDMGEEVDKVSEKLETAAEKAKRLHDEAFKLWLIEDQWREDQLATMEALNAKSKAAQKAAEEALKAQEKALEFIAIYDEEEEGEDVPSFDDMARNWFGLDEAGVEYFKSLIGNGMDYATAKEEALKDMQKRTIAEIGASMGQLSGSFKELGSALDEFGDDNEAAKKAAKAFTMVSILASEAQSIAEGALAISAGIAQSQSVPFPANIAAIATTTAAIGSVLATTISSIKQAKDVFKSADAFASGGVIGGYTSNPSRTDDTYAHVGSGEMILNANQQARLFAIANGAQSSAYESTFAAMTAAMAAMPAPVLTYQEFKDFEQKTTQIQEIAKV